MLYRPILGGRDTKSRMPEGVASCMRGDGWAGSRYAVRAYDDPPPPDPPFLLTDEITKPESDTMHTENPETNGSENPETDSPAPRKPLDQLSASEYLALSSSERAFYRRASSGRSSGRSRRVSPRASFIDAAASYKTDKERRELALAATPKGRTSVYTGLSRASAGHLHDMGHTVASDVKNLPSVVVFEGGARVKKTIVSDKASLVYGAIELLERLEDAKAEGLPRNHPERRAIVSALRNLGK